MSRPETETPRAPVRAYLGLGSNLGDRHANLTRAVEMLGAREGIAVLKTSGLHQTAPVGGPPGQGEFLNAAVSVETTLAPRELLCTCLEIERELGRTRGPDDVRWGPRTIDIDILLYGDEVVREPGLEIPHPRMHERTFVLLPLVQIAPEARHPALERSVAQLARTVAQVERAGGGADEAQEGRRQAIRAAKSPAGS